MLVVLQFIVLAALAVGIAVTSSTAQHALAVNEKRASETKALRGQVSSLSRQNDELLAQIDALRRQVEALGGTPVEVTIQDNRSGSSTTPTTRPPPATTTTTAPRPTTTTTAPPPCQLQVGGRCVVPG